MEERLSALLERLRQDNTSGATDLTLAALDLLTVFAEKTGPAQPFYQALIKLLGNVLDTQPSMAIIITLIQHVLQACTPELDAEIARKTLRQSLESFRHRIQHNTTALCQQVVHVLPEQATVLTYSNSATVTAALQHAFTHGRLRRVLLSESRPAYDGRVQALSLLRYGIPVEFSVDMALFERLSEANIVLVGADAVTAHGLCNKLGTRALAHLARQQRVPMFSLCTTSKFLPAAAASFLHIADHSSQEVWPEAPASLHIVNRYFDTTPLSLLQGIISEEGSHTPEVLQKQLAELPLSAALQELLSSRSAGNH